LGEALATVFVVVVVLEVSVLSMAFGLEKSLVASPESSRHRPVALELQEHIRACGCDVQGPQWEGPFKIDAVTDGISFCLMPEDAYFKKLSGSFSSARAPLEENKLELCHERF